ncbi:MAG: phosphoribosylformylglycinamidine cyclo-ligase [Thermoflexus hugenholtzii]|jgi:phosphoribosylformylglycinamidine cyclo-ligase|uniref:phosphoribosylformylglycinamidine cyclo-ligase n=1 Tax=Thermoflexus TaxID=1495649 RepID=UPI001C783998|nr:MULTISPECIES: phosphoribosylformylglycinamidine cyclo-ligase [Thermoflexus]QWK11912.1 MAG: phosphoribosylformylglycinamidine cyclo-ligase [Thermoflexus hugenholtzii]
MPAEAYAQAGVRLDVARDIRRRIADAVRSTYGSEVIAGIGAFAGLYRADALRGMEEPVLVASTDGVGTKLKVAARLNRWETVGYDLVHHCVNDILVHGARPLFFLDYIAAARLDPEVIVRVVESVAAACREVGCALLGGETAELPGVYAPGELDLVGTIVGVVERPRIRDGSRIRPGDRLLALPSSGLHTNGYSLARRVLADQNWERPLPELGTSIGEALLAPHRCYLEPIRRLEAAGIDLKGLCHITGGGVYENLPRVLPPGTAAVLRRGTWPEPPIFGLIQRLGGIPDEEMFHVFNMGLGMLLVVPPCDVEPAQAVLPGEVWLVGEIVEGDRTVRVEA